MSAFARNPPGGRVRAHGSFDRGEARTKLTILEDGAEATRRMVRTVHKNGPMRRINVEANSGGLVRVFLRVQLQRTVDMGKIDSWVGFKRAPDSPLYRKARRGFRGYPIATIALYGPDDRIATKVAVAIIAEQDAEPVALNRWFSNGQDVRSDLGISGEVLTFIKDHGARSVVLTERIIGCPHEEGVDYPDGAICPQCPFWAHRDRWSGEVIQ